MESKFETVLPSVTRTAQSDCSITTGKIIMSKIFFHRSNKNIFLPQVSGEERVDPVPVWPEPGCVHLSPLLHVQVPRLQHSPPPVRHPAVWQGGLWGASVCHRPRLGDRPLSARPNLGLGRGGRQDEDDGQHHRVRGGARGHCSW